MEEKIICSMNGVGIYGVISICIFVGFFAGTLLWTFAQKKNHLDRMGSLPLDGSENSNDKL
jgi:hypothetical protein